MYVLLDYIIHLFISYYFLIIDRILISSMVEFGHILLTLKG